MTMTQRIRAASTPYLLFGVIVVGVGAYGIWHWLGGERTVVNELVTHPIEKRSFNVTFQEKGELKAASSKEIKCQVEGRSTVIFLIPEGSMVKSGDLLVQLASNEIENNIRQQELSENSAKSAVDSAETDLDIQRQQNTSDIEQANLRVTLAELDLKKYEEGDWQLAQRDADIAIEQAELTLKRRQEDFSASDELYAKKYITVTELEEDRLALKKAEWDLEKARRQKELLHSVTRAKDSQEKQAAVREAQSNKIRVEKNAQAAEKGKMTALDNRKKELTLVQDKLAQLRRQKENCQIVAPAAGLVVYAATSSGRFMSSDEQVKEGATVFERQTLMTLVDTTKMNVLLRIHESKTNRIAIGQPARVQVEGLPGQSFAGHLCKIGMLAESQNRFLNPDLKEYEVEIELDEASAQLKPGVTAVAEIMVGQIRDVPAVPVQAVFSRAGKSYVFSAKGADIAPEAVKLGASSTEWVEIKEGAEVGERILLAVRDDLLRKLPDAPPGAVDNSDWAAKAGMNLPNASEGGAGAPGQRSPGGGRPGSGERGGASGERTGPPGDRPAGASGDRPAGTGRDRSGGGFEGRPSGDRPPGSTGGPGSGRSRPSPSGGGDSAPPQAPPPAAPPPSDTTKPAQPAP